MIKFNLNEKEEMAFEKWYAKLPKKYKKEQPKFIFQSTGIGDIVIVNCMGKEINVTDVSCW